MAHFIGQHGVLLTHLSRPHPLLALAILIAEDTVCRVMVCNIETQAYKKKNLNQECV